MAKQPKEPKKWKYPRLYATVNKKTVVDPDNSALGGIAGLIIIYPDGRPPEMAWADMYSYQEYTWRNHPPCWYEERTMRGKPELQVKAFKEYAQNDYIINRSFHRIFIGEVK